MKLVAFYCVMVELCFRELTQTSATGRGLSATNPTTVGETRDKGKRWSSKLRGGPRLHSDVGGGRRKKGQSLRTGRCKEQEGHEMLNRQRSGDLEMVEFSRDQVTCSGVARMGEGNFKLLHDSIKQPVWSRRFVAKFV